MLLWAIDHVNKALMGEMHSSSHCLHESRLKCSSGEESRLELLLTCNVSKRVTVETSVCRGDLELSVVTYRRALHRVTCVFRVEVLLPGTR